MNLEGKGHKWCPLCFADFKPREHLRPVVVNGENMDAHRKCVTHSLRRRPVIFSRVVNVTAEQIDRIEAELDRRDLEIEAL